jgi:hypothetical protein
MTAQSPAQELGLRLTGRPADQALADLVPVKKLSDRVYEWPGSSFGSRSPAARSIAIS